MKKFYVINTKEWLEVSIDTPLSIKELLKIIESHRRLDIDQKEDLVLEVRYVGTDICGENMEPECWSVPVLNPDFSLIAPRIGSCEICVWQGERHPELVLSLKPTSRGFVSNSSLVLDYDKFDCLIKVLRVIERACRN